MQQNNSLPAHDKILSPHVRKSGFWNQGSFCFENQVALTRVQNRVPGIQIHSVESRIKDCPEFPYTGPGSGVRDMCKKIYILYIGPGARFSKVPIINRPGKLSPFTLKIKVSIVLHLT